MTELDEEGNAEHFLEISADVEHSLKDRLPLLYGDEAPRLGSGHSPSVTKRKPLLTIMTTGGQSKKAARASPF